MLACAAGKAGTLQHGLRWLPKNLQREVSQCHPGLPIAYSMPDGATSWTAAKSASCSEWPYARPTCRSSLMHIHGPGGVGKSALLREFTAIAAEQGAAAYYLDARNSEPSPDAFVNVLRLTLGLGDQEAPATALANRPGRHVIMLDTYELFTPLDNWLREIFLPLLPDNVLVVLAGRNQPSPGWRADPGWQALLRVLPLRNLSSEESRQYLTLRGVPPEQCQAVLHFTHGHPLALSLVAETFAQRVALGRFARTPRRT